MHVANLDPSLVQILGQVLRHPLGQRRDERTVTCSGRRLDLVDAVVDLILDRLDLDRRVDKTRRADNLFGEHAAGLFHFPRPRGCRYTNRLRPHRIPFIEA